VYVAVRRKTTKDPLFGPRIEYDNCRIRSCHVLRGTAMFVLSSARGMPDSILYSFTGNPGI
jgi:hypothetical protein